MNENAVLELVSRQSIIMRGDERYPRSLESVPEPPNTLYVIGEYEGIDQGIAIVGNHRASPDGAGLATRYAREAVERGWAVVTDFSSGCCRAAIGSALAAGGRVIVVDECMRFSSRSDDDLNLLGSILDAGGSLVSDRPWCTGEGTRSAWSHFRLQSKMAKAVLVVEARRPFEASAMVWDALAIGKLVMAIPATKPFASVEIDALFERGAIPVEGTSSFVRALGMCSKGAAKRDAPCIDGITDTLNATQRLISSLLDKYGLSCDELGLVAQDMVLSSDDWETWDEAVVTVDTIVGTCASLGYYAFRGENDSWKVIPAEGMSNGIRNRTVIAREGSDALVFTSLFLPSPFVIAHGYDERDGSWAYGTYMSDPSRAWDEMSSEIIEDATVKWCLRDVAAVLVSKGVEPEKRILKRIAHGTARKLREASIDSGWNALSQYVESALESGELKDCLPCSADRAVEVVGGLRSRGCCEVGTYDDWACLGYDVSDLLGIKDLPGVHVGEKDSFILVSIDQ